ncbi:MAG TPA: hypothetical protein DCE14_07810, partial [Kosmotogaceae bacterium]
LSIVDRSTEGVDRILKATDIVESEIIDLLNENTEDCPICRTSERAVRGWLKGALSDLLHNESARAKLNAGGLCRVHSETFIQVVRSDSGIGSLSAAIMLCDILRRQIQDIKELESGKRRRRRGFSKVGNRCHMCKVFSETEQRFVNAFAVFFNKMVVREAFENSNSVICVEHTRQMSRINTTCKEWFLSIQQKKLKALLDDMEILMKKHDYRNTEPIGRESSSWVRTVRVIGERE